MPRAETELGRPPPAASRVLATTFQRVSIFYNQFGYWLFRLKLFCCAMAFGKLPLLILGLLANLPRFRGMFCHWVIGWQISSLYWRFKPVRLHEITIWCVNANKTRPALDKLAFVHLFLVMSIYVPMCLRTYNKVWLIDWKLEKKLKIRCSSPWCR